MQRLAMGSLLTGSVYFLPSLYREKTMQRRQIHVTGRYMEPSSICSWWNQYYVTDATGQTYRVPKKATWETYRVGEMYSVKTYGVKTDWTFPRVEDGTH